MIRSISIKMEHMLFQIYFEILHLFSFMCGLNVHVDERSIERTNELTDIFESFLFLFQFLIYSDFYIYIFGHGMCRL